MLPLHRRDPERVPATDGGPSCWTFLNHGIWTDTPDEPLAERAFVGWIWRWPTGRAL